MSIDSVLAAGRRAAESRMTSRATVKRLGTAAPDPDGFEVDGWVQVYSGSFRLAGSRNTAGSRTISVGDVEVTLAVRTAHFPASVTDLRDGDVIEVVEGENAGAFLRIVESVWQDQATARRVPVIETQKPGGWS